jgi:hypothetical protein
MEHERRIPRPDRPGDGADSAPDPGDLDRIRAEGDGLLDAADRILDSLQPVEAELYLEQGRQRGGE